MMHHTTTIILLMGMCFSLSADAAVRVWTDGSGKYKIEAELVQVRDGNALLRRQDGREITVPVERLSSADQAFLASQTQPQLAMASGEGLTLVKDGVATSVIVTNGRPKEGQEIAALELQQHLQLMSGATVPIVQEDEWQRDPSQVLILVGSSNLSQEHGVDTREIEPETFFVKTTDDALILVGDDGGSRKNARTGTLWAVYDFLQDQLGCRWIWPGDIGRVVPQRKTVVVPPLDVKETPVIKIRGFRMVCQEKHRIAYEKEGLAKYLDFGDVYQRVSEDERTWLRRMRMGRSFKLSYGHAFTDWWEKYKDSDPDLFALQPNGRRGPRKSSQPDFVKMCVSNPKLWDFQLADLRKYAKQGATGLWVNACENDGSGGFCTCDRCRAWDADPNADLTSLPPVEDGSDVDDHRGDDLPASLSDRYARWCNELARLARESDPEARVIAYAYSRYRSPPSQLKKLEPNVWIGYVGFNAYPRSDEYHQMSVDEWSGWSHLGATVFLRSNSMFFCGEGVPHVASHQIAEDCQFQVHNGLRAVDFDCLQGYWATTGPSYYVLARMLWDTDADPDEILAEFYGAFGPMTSVVQEYFDYWEQFTTKMGNSPDLKELNRTERLQAFPRIYQRETFARARAILDKATPLLANASQSERERFRNIVLGLQHGELLVDALRDGKTANSGEGERLFAFRKEIAARNVINVYWTTSKEKRYRVFE